MAGGTWIPLGTVITVVFSVTDKETTGLFFMTEFVEIAKKYNEFSSCTIKDLIPSSSSKFLISPANFPNLENWIISFVSFDNKF